MTEYLRVTQTDAGTGREFSIPKTQYDFAPDGFEVLDKPAVDTGGNPLPPKERTTAKKAAESKKATTPGRQAATNKEND